MDVEFAVLADYAAGTNDGKLVVGGIFDTLHVARLPASHPLMTVAVRIRAHPGEEGSHRVRVRVVDPDGEEIVPSMDAEVTLPTLDPSEGGTAQIVMQIAGARFAKAGRHGVDVFVDGRFERTILLSVQISEPA